MKTAFFFKVGCIKKRFLNVKTPKLPQRDRKEETKSFMLHSFDKKKNRLNLQKQQISKYFC